MRSLLEQHRRQLSDGITAAIASDIASVGSMTATYTTGISDQLIK